MCRPCKKTKIPVKCEGDGDTNSSDYAWNHFKRPEKKTPGIGDQRKD